MLAALPSTSLRMPTPDLLRVICAASVARYDGVNGRDRTPATTDFDDTVVVCALANTLSTHEEVLIVECPTSAAG